MHDDYYKNKIWDTPEKTNGGRVLSRQIELYQKTIGIIGLGNIGLWMDSHDNRLGSQSCIQCNKIERRQMGRKSSGS